MFRSLVFVAFTLTVTGCKVDTKPHSTNEIPPLKTSHKTAGDEALLKSPIEPIEKDRCESGDDECFVKRLGTVTIGTFKIGGKIPPIIRSLGKPSLKTERVTWEATGDIAENRKWAKKGIAMSVASPDMKSDPTRILSITVTLPSTWQTDRRIGIGGTVADVQKQYNDSIYLYPL